MISAPVSMRGVRARRLFTVPASRLVAYLGVCTILVYGSLMEPTPDSLTAPLMVWVIVAAIPVIVSVRYASQLPLYNFLLAAIIMIGMLSGMYALNDLIQFVRDLISFAFWVFGPLLILLIVSKPRTGDPILTLEQVRLTLALAGTALSVRYFFQQEVSLTAALSVDLRANLQYLSSEPLVTFAFIYAGMSIFRARRVFGMIGFLVLFLLASIGLIAVTYRGPLLLGSAMFMIAWAVSAFAGERPSPLWVVLTIVIVVLMLYFLQDQISAVGTKIFNKFERVGTNSKFEEFLQVFDSDVDAWQVIFGSGFGGRVFLVGAGTMTGYAHNLISYAFIKSGYAGVILVIITLVSSLSRVLVTARRAWHYSPEIVTILYIGLFQAAFKHFGYGLLLGVCLAAGHEFRRSEHL